MADDVKVNLGPGPRPTVAEVLDEWRGRIHLTRGSRSGALAEGPDGRLVPDVSHLAMHAEDLARDLAAAGCDVRGTEGSATSATVLLADGSVTIDAEVCNWPGRPTFVRLSIREAGDAAMADAVRRKLGRLVNESVTQKSLDHLLLDPTLVGLPRGTVDRLLAIEQDHAALRAAVAALLADVEPADLPGRGEKLLVVRALLATVGQDPAPLPDPPP